ncbi:MAG: DUF2147 domain-containing protein [Gammaproteobacteria bacterium]
MRELAIALLAVLMLSGLPAQAANDTPVGRWKTIDDDTGKATSIIRIRNIDGELRGWIARVLKTREEGALPTCTLCEGELKDAPVQGLRFMWGLKREGDAWTGGQIVDPETGKIYNAKIELQDHGRELLVRGYIGIPLFGRTQTWERIE